MKVTPVRAIGWLGVLFTVAMILLSVIVQDLPSSTRLAALGAEDLQRPLRSAVVQWERTVYVRRAPTNSSQFARNRGSIGSARYFDGKSRRAADGQPVKAG